MAYYVPPSEKVGRHVPRVPHQISTMLYIHSGVATVWATWGGS